MFSFNLFRLSSNIVEMDSCAGIGDDVDDDNSILFNVVAANAPSAPTTFVSAAKSVPI